MTWTKRLRARWEREWERLREGYEAQLLIDAQDERAESARDERSRHLKLVPREAPAGALPIPIEIRPQTVTYGELLRPVVLQFTLPCLAVTVLAEIAKGPAMWEHGVFATVFLTPLWFGFKGWFFTAMGRWLFGDRWARLRRECYERWQWRAAAALGDEPKRLALATAPAGPDESAAARPPA